MEIVHSGSRGTAIVAVGFSSQVTQLNQLILQIGNCCAGHALAKGCEGIYRAAGIGSCAGQRTGRVKQYLGVIACGTVFMQAILPLEGTDGCHVICFANAIHRCTVVTQSGETLLQSGHRIAGNAQLNDRHIVLGNGRRGRRGRGCRRGDRGRRCRCTGRQSVDAEKQIVGTIARNTIRIQSVIGLEILQGRHAAGAEIAIYLAGIVAQLLQPLLHQLGIAAGAALLHLAFRHGKGRHRGGRRRRNRRRGCIHRKCVTAKQKLLRLSTGNAIRRQAVLLLECLCGTLGCGIIGAGNIAGIIAQFLQPGLNGFHQLAGIVQANNHSVHRGKGHDRRLDPLAVLRRAAVEHGLQICIGNASHRVAVGGLEGSHRILGSIAEFAVGLPGQETKLNQRTLQCLHGRALRTLLQHHVRGRVLNRLQGGHRRGCGSDLDHLLEHNVVCLYVAFCAVVFHLCKGAGHALHRQCCALGNLLQDVTVGGLPCPQVHAVAGHRIIRVPGHRFHRHRRRGNDDRLIGNDVGLQNVPGTIVVGHLEVIAG